MKVFEHLGKRELLAALKEQKSRSEIIASIYKEVQSILFAAFNSPSPVIDFDTRLHKLFMYFRVSQTREQVGELMNEAYITLGQKIMNDEFEGGAKEQKPLDALKAYWVTICKWEYIAQRRKQMIVPEKESEEEGKKELREISLTDKEAFVAEPLRQDVELKMDLDAAFARLNEKCQRIIEILVFQDQSCYEESTRSLVGFQTEASCMDAKSKCVSNYRNELKKGSSIWEIIKQKFR
ncbi:MAG: hypothetical protein ACKVTZ_01710 [Bacteroidia bacterium]